jgi:hypothetical protein
MPSNSYPEAPRFRAQAAPTADPVKTHSIGQDARHLGMDEISARLECEHEFETLPEIKKVAEMLRDSKVRAKGGPWRIMKRLGSLSAPVPWLIS